MSYVSPDQVVDAAVEAGAAKARASTVQLLARGTLAGAILAAATTFALTASAQSVPLVGAIVFPAGFVMIVILGLDLVTGNFALVPLAVAERRTTVRSALRNFFWVIVGHLIGCVGYAVACTAVLTHMGTDHSDPMIAQIVSLAEAKTTAYAAIGGAGLALVVLKAVLCDWMVALGAVMALTARSTGGKIIAMWLPVTLFFALGFEHAVVNMFVIPAGMMLGADVSFADWWGTNQLPVLVGNLLGGVTLTAGLLYLSHRRRLRVARPGPVPEQTPVAAELDREPVTVA